MHYRTTCSTAFRAKSLTSIFAMVLVCLWPRASVAQGVLPIQWLYSPITRVNSVVYSPDGSMLAVGGDYGIQILNAVTGTPLMGLPTAAAAGTVSSVAFSPDGMTLAVGGRSISGGVLELWDVSTGKLLYTLNTGANKLVDSVAFSPDGKTLADGGQNYNFSNGVYTGVLETWDVSTGTLNITLNSAANSQVYSVAFSSDGKTLADGGNSDIDGVFHCVLEIWNVSTSMRIYSLNTAASYYVSSVAFSPDGTTLADGSVDSDVLELWNVSTGKRVKTLHTAEGVSSVAFSPDGTRITAGEYGPVQSFTASTGHLLETLDTTNDQDLSVAFSPDGTALAAGGVGRDTNGYDFGALDLWNVATGKLLDTFSTTAYSVNFAIAFSPDGGTIAVGANNDGLELWDVATGALIAALSTTYTVNSVAFSPDGETLAVGGSYYGAGGYAQGVLELWNVATGKLITTFSTAADWVSSVAFSSDGTTIADGSFFNGVLELWNVSTGKLIKTLNSSVLEIYSVAFSPNGDTLADGGQNSGGIPTLELWNVSNGRLHTRANVADSAGQIFSVAFSPDGKTLAVGGSADNDYQNVLELWNVSNGKLLAKLNTDSQDVGSVAFSPDGKILFATTEANMQAFNLANDSLIPSVYLNYTQTTGGGVASIVVSSSGILLAYNTGFGALVIAENPFYDTVPAPTLTGLSPGSAYAEGAAFKLTVTGTDFANGAIVNWNGTPLTTSFVSATKLTSTVPAADIASAGTASVTATNPGSATSNPLTFMINNPRPVLSSISPNSASHGSGSLTITLTGTNFLADSMVEWTADGTTTALATTYVSSTQLTATVTSNLFADTGKATVHVFNPAPGGGTSAAQKFTIR